MINRAECLGNQKFREVSWKIKWWCLKVRLGNMIFRELTQNLLLILSPSTLLRFEVSKLVNCCDDIQIVGLWKFFPLICPQTQAIRLWMTSPTHKVPLKTSISCRQDLIIKGVFNLWHSTCVSRSSHWWCGRVWRWNVRQCCESIAMCRRWCSSWFTHKISDQLGKWIEKVHKKVSHLQTLNT